jgi:hypothetical protein
MRIRLSLLPLLILAVVLSTFETAHAACPAPDAPDISGEWRLENHEDPGQLGALGQPPLGDYLGIPFNDAGRMRADTSAESIWGTPEYQCRPHSAPHQWRGLGGVRILKEQDPLTRDVTAYHVQFMRSLDADLHGRPSAPPAYAPHTWTGFSTGEWVGNTLKVVTTHLKDGYLKRGGPQTSDLYTMTEFITRHDENPDRSRRSSTTRCIRTSRTCSPRPTCTTRPARRRRTLQRVVVRRERRQRSHYVPHFLPGQNTRAHGMAEGGRLGAGSAPAVASRPIYRSIAPSLRHDDQRGAHGPSVEDGRLDRKADRRTESRGRTGARAAGAGQRVHADRGRRQRDGIDSGPKGRCS